MVCSCEPGRPQLTARSIERESIFTAGGRVIEWFLSIGEVHMKTNTENEYSEIAADLKKRVEAVNHFYRYSRLLYWTDDSMYQIELIGVVVPRHKGDVQAVIET